MRGFPSFSPSERQWNILCWGYSGTYELKGDVCMFVTHAHVCAHTHKHTCPLTHGDLSSHHWPEAWLKEAALGWRWAPSAVVLGRLRLTYPQFTNEEMTLQSPLGRAGRGERRVGSSYNVWLCHHETSDSVQITDAKSKRTVSTEIN